MKEKKYLVLSTVILIALLVFGVSYSFYKARIEGNTKSISLKTKGIYLLYKGDLNLVSGYIEPGWSVTKTFTIENQSSSEEKYDIYIKDLVNTFETSGYLQYKITSTNSGYNMTGYKDIPKSSIATDTVLAYSVTINPKEEQEYTIELIYKDTEEDQSEDMGKILSGKLYISEGSNPTLTYAILRDNPTRSTRSNNNNGTNDFSTPFTETTTGTLFTSTESITGITSTPVNVYYYSGDAKNNWIKFGKYQNDLIRYRGYYSTTNTSSYIEYSTMDECTSSASIYNKNCTEYKYANTGDDIYWRIIRTNHDGSIRLLYVGTSHDTTTGGIGKIAFNTSSNSPKYVGYKYGEDTSLNTIRNNTTDSTIKTYIDTWYQNNLTNYTKYLSTSAVYCNDRSEETEGSYTTSSTDFGFASYKRLKTDKTPTYNCSDIRDAFSVENTSAQLSYPIALMTADEIAFAGGTWYVHMLPPYAWFISNSSGTQVSSSWLPLSPFGWEGSNARVWSWSFGGARMDRDNVDIAYAVRPAISLKSCVKVTGRGTADDPYVVDYEGSCN